MIHFKQLLFILILSSCVQINSNLFAIITIPKKMFDDIQMHITKNDFKNAIPILKEALQIKPFSEKLLKLLAYSYLSQKQYLAAENTYRMAICASSENDTELLKGFSQSLLAQNKYKETLPIVLKLSEKHPLNKSFRVLLGKLYMKNNQNKKALEVFESTQALGLLNSKELILTADLYYTLGLKDKAIQYYLNTLNKENLSDKCLYRIAETLLYSRKTKEAIKFIQKIKDKKKMQLKILLLNAKIAENKANPIKTIQIYEKILKKDPLNSKVMFKLANLYKENNKTIEALTMLKRLTIIKGCKYNAFICIANINIREKKYAKAIDYFEKALNFKEDKNIKIIIKNLKTRL